MIFFSWIEKAFKKKTSGEVLSLKEVKKVVTELVVGDEVVIWFKNPEILFSPAPPSRWNLSPSENKGGKIKGVVTSVLYANEAIGLEISSIKINKGNSIWRSTSFLLDEITKIELFEKGKDS